MYYSKLYIAFSYFSFHNYWIIWISAFASFCDIPIWITSSAIELKLYAIVAGIIKYKSRIKEKKNKHDKIALLAQSKLNNIEVLISKALSDSNISHDQFVLINSLLKEYGKTKEEIENLKN